MKPIQKAIIPIAGYGTRLFPAAKAVPKALFSIIAEDGIANPVIMSLTRFAKCDILFLFSIVRSYAMNNETIFTVRNEDLNLLDSEHSR